MSHNLYGGLYVIKRPSSNQAADQSVGGQRTCAQETDTVVEYSLETTISYLISVEKEDYSHKS